MEKIVNPDKKIIDEALVFLERDFDKKTYPFLNQPHVNYFKKKLFKKFLRNPEAALYINRNEQAVTAVVFFVFLGWDTNIFGFKAGRFEHLLMRAEEASDNRRFLSEVINDIKAQGYKHVNCRAGLKDYGALNMLERLGFNVADIQLTLSTPDGYTASGEFPENFILRDAAAKDMERLKNIVKGGFTDTRFVNDLRYPRDGVDKMYSEWIGNSFSNFSKKIFVVEEKNTGKVDGFLIGGIDEDSEECLGCKIGFFELAAVSGDCRNQGIFQMLIRHSIRWFKEKNMEKVEARTQVSNVQALRAFMHGGLSDICADPTQSAGVTMHIWF